MVDVEDKAESTTVLFACASIAFNLFNKSVVKSFVDNPFPLTLSTLLFKAVFIALFCNGLVEVEDKDESTTVLLAPADIPSNFVFKSLVKSLVDKDFPLTLSTLLFKELYITLF